MSNDLLHRAPLSLFLERGEFSRHALARCLSDLFDALEEAGVLATNAEWNSGPVRTYDFDGTGLERWHLTGPSPHGTRRCSVISWTIPPTSASSNPLVARPSRPAVVALRYHQNEEYLAPLADRVGALRMAAAELEAALWS